MMPNCNHRTKPLRAANLVFVFLLLTTLNNNNNGVANAFSSIAATSATTPTQAAPENKEEAPYQIASAASQDRVSLGNLKVPHVGIGTIAWSSNKVTSVQHRELQSLVDTACENNVAFFDTAERYGSSLKAAIGMGWGETEILTRDLLKLQHGRAQVATKFTPSPWRTTVESVVDACENSRKRLGVDQIDLYQLHMPDIVQPFQRFGSKNPKDVTYWQGLAECYHRGLVKNIGVSNYGPTLLAKCQEVLAAEGVPLASNQIAYSLLGRHNGSQETLDYCNENNIRVLGFFPLAMGLLTGKYNTPQEMKRPGKDSSLKISKKSSIETKDLVAYSRRISPLLAEMQELADRHRKSISQVALNYVICKGAIPIPGARTQRQLADNAGAMGWRLSNAEVEQLEFASDRLGFGFDGAGFKRASEKFVGYGMETWTLD